MKKFTKRLAKVKGMADKKFLSWIVLFLLLLGLRLLVLNADAPANLGDGRGVYTDEAFWAHNVFNKINYGSWIKDEFNYMYLSPLYNFIVYAVLGKIGLNYLHLRLIAVFFSSLGLVVFFLLCRQRFNFRYSLLAASLLGGNYVFCLYNRLGLVENLVILFILLGFYFLGLAGKNNGYVFLSGIFIGCAYLTKSTAAVFLLIFPLGLWYRYYRSPEKGGNLRPGAIFAWFLLGVGLVLVLYFLFFFYPNREAIIYLNRAYLSKWGWPHNWTGIGRNLQTFWSIPLFAKMPVVSLLAMAGFFLYCRPDRKNIDRSALDFCFSLWLGLGIVFLSVFSYHSIRYALYLVPALVYFTVYWLMALNSGEKVSFGFYSRRILDYIFVVAVYLMVRYELLYFWRDLAFYSLTTKVLLELSALIILVTMYKAIRRILALENGNWRRRLALILVTLILAVDVGALLKYFARPEYQVRKINQLLLKQYPGAVLGGAWAPALSFETPLRSVPIMPEFVNDRDTFKKFPLTHLILEDRDEELQFIRTVYPEVAARLKLLAEFKVGEYQLYLFQIARQGKEKI